MKIGNIEPKIMSLRKFFDEESSNLLIPTIQRQFVWDGEDIKELIDSIINGYPIGAIIVWEPTSKFPGVPLIGKENERGINKYVLDGQQRLTALVLIKNGWNISRGSKMINITPISFVPENEKFYIGEKKGINISLLVNASLGEPKAITKLQREFPTTYEKAMKSVATKIINYEMPFYYLKSDTAQKEDEEIYEKIAEIFTRVNSAGVKIGNLEMFLSFFAAAFPKGPKDKIIEIHEELNDLYELDLEPIIRFIFSKMEMKQNQITKVSSFKKAIKKIKEKYIEKESKIYSLLNRAYRSIKIIMKMIKEETGITTTDFLPSQNALLPLFNAIFEANIRETDNLSTKVRNKMLKWFLIGSFNGIYSSSPNKKIQRDLDIISEKENKFPLKTLLTAMKEQIRTDTIEKEEIVDAYKDVLRGRVGKQYLMLLTTLLYRNNASDWSGRKIRTEDIAIHHIFPREYLKENGITDSTMINCIGNLTLISPSVNREIGDAPPSEYLPNYGKEVLQQHFIPTEKKLWDIEKYEDFLERRLNFIQKATQKTLDELY